MKYLGTASLLFLFLACNAFENENPELLAIQGTWELERFNGGIGGWTTDMDTAGYTVSLKISGTKGVWLVDDEVETKYNISSATDNDNLLKFTSYERNTEQINIPRYLRSIQENQIVIIDDCFDCFLYTFIRKKN